MQQAELRLATTGGWRPTTIDDALRLGSSLTYRCAECNGQVRAHAPGADGSTAHFEHRERNPGCSLIPQHFDGTKRRHRSALE